MWSVRAAVAAVALLVIATSCRSSSPLAFIDELVVVITVPTGMTGGQEAQWQADWTGGEGPYQVNWDFGGGAETTGMTTTCCSVTLTALMVNPSNLAAAQYAYSVQVWDAEGRSGNSPVTGTYTVAAAPNSAPSIDNASVDGSELTVNVSDPDGDTIWVSLEHGYGMYSEPDGVVVEGGTGEAEFTVTTYDLIGGAGQLLVIADDHKAEPVSVSISGMDAVTLNGSVLYAFPLERTVAVNEPVTIVIATGMLDEFQFLNGVSVTVENDAEYVGGSFNPGAPGGGLDEPDGAWAAMSPFSFLKPPMPLYLPTDIGNGRERWDFNLTPIGGKDITAEGALFNFQFEFSEPGVKHLGLQEVSGVSRTYYSDGDSTEYFWSELMADEWGNLNEPNADNTITITAP